MRKHLKPLSLIMINFVMSSCATVQPVPTRSLAEVVAAPPSSAPSSTPSSPPTAGDVIKAADSAIAAKDREITDTKAAQDALKKDLEATQKELVDSKGKLDSFLAKPEYTVPIGAMVALGIVVNPLIFVGAGVMILLGVIKH